MARQVVPTSGLWSAIAGLLNTNFTEAYDNTGWALYRDTAYTPASPLAVLANTNTLVPNNAGTIIDTQLPSDVTSFYTGGKIVGKEGDGMLITIDLFAVPTEAGTTTLEVWFDIGGTIGELYRRIITFPKGVGEIRPINFTSNVYQLDTWAANGASVYIRANGACSIYDIRYVLSRVHKAI